MGALFFLTAVHIRFVVDKLARGRLLEYLALSCRYHPILSIFILASSGVWAVAVLWTAFLKHLTRHPSTRMEEEALCGAEPVWNRAAACLPFRCVCTQQRGDLTRLAYWDTSICAARRDKACILGHFYLCCKKGQGLHTGTLLFVLQEGVQAVSN